MDEKMLQFGTQNVGDAERVLSVLAGSGLALAAVRRAPLALLLLLLGIGLLVRGLTGYCNIYHFLGISTSREASVPDTSELRGARDSSRQPASLDDRVLEASEESFPASDPPAFNA